MGLTFPVIPMKAVAGEMPRDDDGWAYEIKWDGMRIVAFVGNDGEVRLQSARPRDVTPSYPELAGLARATGGRPAILDGEVVALDERGRPSFSRLQHRMHVVGKADAARRAVEVPVAYQLFDLLSFDGTDAISLPYLERRRLLSAVIEPGPTWGVASHHLGGGQALYEVVKDQGLEGLVAKRVDSTYQPGRRSPSWRKIKVRPEQEFVVGGWASGEGRRTGTMGSLLIGYHAPDGSLRYAGRVGTGFSERELDRLMRLLLPLGRDTSPFDPLPPRDHRRDATWVEPELVVQVAYGEWTPDGLLRHPAYLGQRDDKDPRDVTRDA
jgi:bifunctional non-homologous end joining protein LigD